MSRAKYCHFRDANELNLVHLVCLKAYMSMHKCVEFLRIPPKIITQFYSHDQILVLRSKWNFVMGYLGGLYSYDLTSLQLDCREASVVSSQLFISVINDPFL